jgi:hypothetical protein
MEEITVKPQKKPKLTKKQRGFVKDYVLTENGVQSALKNYDVVDYKTASVIASENLDKPYIREAIEVEQKTLAERIPDDLLERVMLEGLQATKMDGKGGMTIGFGKDGDVEGIGHTEMQYPDYAVRHKYLDSAFKLKGSYAPEKSVSVNLNATIENAEQGTEIAEEYEEKLRLTMLEKKHEGGENKTTMV